LGASFIANGDVCVVRRYRNERELYGFRFADATLQFPDFDDMEVDATILLDTLQCEAPALTQERQTELFNAICADYPEVTNRRDLMEKIKKDSYYNALQVKYAYAVTCHKAQGGQWQHVYIDQGYVTEDMLSPDYFRWLYTALTRATERVYLVNWPPQQLEGKSEK
jgi:exodeoxyribonuclease-5